MDKRRKSENRRRTAQVNTRFTPDELDQLDRVRGTLERGTFLRKKALGSAGPRSRRRPHPDKQELAQILGQLGKIGSNLNQLAKRANEDGFHTVDPDELQRAINHVSDMRATLLAALGRRGH